MIWITALPLTNSRLPCDSASNARNDGDMSSGAMWGLRGGRNGAVVMPYEPVRIGMGMIEGDHCPAARPSGEDRGRSRARSSACRLSLVALVPHRVRSSFRGRGRASCAISDIPTSTVVIPSSSRRAPGWFRIRSISAIHEHMGRIIAFVRAWLFDHVGRQDSALGKSIDRPLAAGVVQAARGPRLHSPPLAPDADRA